MKFVSTSLLAFFLLINFSCKRESNYPEPTAEEINANKDASSAFNLLSIVGFANEMEFIARQLPLSPSATSFLGCASITSQTTADGKKFEVIFSSSNACTDNSIRSGKLIITYQTASGNILITPDNYKLAEYKVAGTYLFQPIVEQQKDLLKLTVTNGQLTNNNGNYVKFNLEHKTNFKEGKATTETFADDVLETVSASYRIEIKNDVDGTNQFEASSASPYTLKYSCNEKFRPRSGKIKFQRVVGTDRYILLGNGNCTDLAKISPTP